MFENNKVLIAPDFNVNELIRKNFTESEIIKLMESKGGNNMVFEVADFTKDFLNDLKADKNKITALVKQWSKVKTDPKMNEFIHQLKTKFFETDINPNRKLVIFTESTETSNEIKQKMELAGFSKILAVSSANRNDVEKEIKYNFDANQDLNDYQDNFEIIVTTEVLAEGVNLHRSNIIINYNVPWNSTRLMQRIGRVNRINRHIKANEIPLPIYVFNFYPSSHGDGQIQLHNKALRKLQAFHSAFGEDNKIFSLLEELSENGLGGGNKIKEEESEILKYLIELRQFRKNHKAEFDRIAKIPNKARVCRKQKNLYLNPIYFNDGDMIADDVSQSSITYLKAENHSGVFCYVSAAGNAKNLGFLDAAKLFKANPDEKPIPKHNKHFDQVIIANNLFKSDNVQNNLASISRTDLSPAENKSITNLTLTLKKAPTPQKAKQINSVIDIIKKGGFVGKGLSKKINHFFKSNDSLLFTNIELFYDKLFKEVIDNLNLNSNTASKETKSKNQIVDPRIVLTVSID